jgi:prepilin signal peptidase PulO-like enzyme (type II secretory pathway)
MTMREVRGHATRHRVQVTIATLACAAAAAGGARNDLTLLIALIVLAPFAATMAVIDAHTRKIPTVLVRAAAAATTAVLVTGAAIIGDWPALGRAILATLIIGALFFTKWWFTATGLGDVRLAALLALCAGWDSWTTVLATVVLAYLVALPAALIRLSTGHRKDGLAFGPWLVAGLYLAVLTQGLIPALS